MHPKFARDNVSFAEYIAHLGEFYDAPEELLYYFPAYVGSANLGHFLGYYEFFKMVQGMNGYIADIGTHRGASLCMFGNLVKIFEPHTFTMVHGFDWFQGMQTGVNDNPAIEGKYVSSQQQLQSLLEAQGLERICELHNLDLTRDLPAFFAEREWLRYKIVLMDCAIEEVMRESLKHFWPRLVPGGILLLDHYNHPISPTESRMLEEIAPGHAVRQLGFMRSPTAYVVKPSV